MAGQRWGLMMLIVVAALAGACGDKVTATARGGTGAAGGSGNAGNAASLGDSGLSLGGQSAGGVSNADSGVPLVVTAAKTKIDATGAPVTVQVSAEYQDGSKPKTISWFVDDTTIGSIGDDGVFRANGTVAGTVTVTAQVGSQKGTVQISVSVAIVDNGASLAQGDMDKLRQGGSGGTAGIGPDGTFAFVYPYDETVFPRGLNAPVLQFAGAAADSMYVKIRVGQFSYDGYFVGQKPLRVALPAAIWKGASLSTGAQDWLVVEVSKLAAGAVTGPVKESWRIAQGSLKGLLYYNTYQSALAGNQAAMMRTRFNGSAEIVVAGCNVCHSVSAQGNVLAAGVGWDSSINNPTDSATYDLSAGGSAVQRYKTSEGRMFSFPALYPDGRFALTNGVPSNEPRGLAGDYKSMLVDTKTGQTISTSGLGLDYLRTPSFSPDGKHIAFNNWAESNDGHVIGTYDFDGSSSPPAFSNLKKSVVNSTQKAAWPVFLPDDQALVFHDGDTFDTVAWTAQNSQSPTYANIHLVDLGGANKISTLDELNGRGPNGVYLPYGATEEADMNYEPTVLPVAVGGFYWVMFTSRRCYGNTICVGGTVAGGENKWGSPDVQDETPTPRKKIWVAAIDLDYTGKTDPSHPAFYLDGQEIASGNMRSFAALEPCKSKGASCESGAECCDGFCRETSRGTDGAPVLTCVPPPSNSCSNIDEVCTTAANCCVATYLCINGRCALPAPPPPIK